MALKFRRGTTAQKSGSLAVGEPYINYDLQTLQIGTDQGDVTLSTTSPTATSAVASISASNFLSASYLEIVNDANIKGNDVGVIAQEIEQILPQIVTNRDNGFKAVQYEKIIPLLIEAIKELSAKVDSLENK